MSQASTSDRPSSAAAGCDIDGLATRIQAVGSEMGLPFIAVSSDIGSPEPVRNSHGQPFAEALFRWVDPDLRYWEDRGFALRSFFIQAVRVCAEPIYFSGGKLATWRDHPGLDAVNINSPAEGFSVGAAIIAPAYLPGGVIGAVVWASADEMLAVADIFAERAPALHALALRFVAADHDRNTPPAAVAPAPLTRREIQCLKWGAAGKTDGEISLIMHISVPTVRFHMTNAARKLNVSGRSQTIYRAAVLGYVGGGMNAH